jgi:predicted HicB family RNase H-like nuclease
MSTTTSNRGRTPVRSVRVPDLVWRAAAERAAAEGRSVADVIVAALRRYVGQP